MWMKMIDQHFGAPEGEDNDEMAKAMAISMPIRNLVTFGVLKKEDMLKELKEMMEEAE